MTGGPGKEHGTNKPPSTGRVQQRSKGDTTCPTTSQNPRWHPSRVNKVCITWKDSESGWLVKDNPETNPITIKPESHVAELFSWVPLAYCSPSRVSFPNKSLASSALVSPRTIHFWVLDKSPVLGPGRGPPSCNTIMALVIFLFVKSTINVFSLIRWFNSTMSIYVVPGARFTAGLLLTYSRIQRNCKVGNEEKLKAEWL